MRILPAALLLGSLLAGAPAFAAETAALTAIDQGLSAAQLRSCPPPPAICDPDPGCTPSFDDCSRQLNAITFVRQKPNYVCVYRCDYTDTCHDTACGILLPQITSGSYRVRTEPILPPESCPPADLSMCTSLALE